MSAQYAVDIKIRVVCQSNDDAVDLMNRAKDWCDHNDIMGQEWHKTFAVLPFFSFDEDEQAALQYEHPGGL